MADNRLKTEIATLERKIKLLLSEHHRLQEDLGNYRVENEALKQKIESKQQELSSFQNQHKISKIVDNMAGGNDGSAELKAVLDQYIKEIDKCIIHLNEA